jgi:hypothetical protein
MGHVPSLGKQGRQHAKLRFAQAEWTDVMVEHECHLVSEEQHHAAQQHLLYRDVVELERKATQIGLDHFDLLG